MYIRLFDFWKSFFCICFFKYIFNFYIGCDYVCVYCYIISYIFNVFCVRIKEGFFFKFEKEFRKFDKNVIVVFLYLFDLYLIIEWEFGIIRKVFEFFRGYNVCCFFLMKFDIFERDIDILSELRCVVGVIVMIVDEKKVKFFEFNVLFLKRRMKVLKKVKDVGIFVYVWIDLIIFYYIWEDFDEMFDVFFFVSYIMVFIFKFRFDLKKRMFVKFLEFMEKLWLFYERGERIGGYYYFLKDVRMFILREVEKKIIEKGIMFGLCWEGYCLFLMCDGFYFVL